MKLHTLRLNYLVVFPLAVLLLASPVLAEPPAVSPEINRYYQDPEWGQWVNTFERQGREVYDRRHEIVQASRLRPGMDVADIGAGTGLFTRLFASRVAPEGSVYAVDISKTFVENILRTSHEQGLKNVKGIVNTQRSVELPANSIDLAFICDTYHHFEYPRQTMASVHQALRPRGRVIIIDFRREPGKSSGWVMDHVRAGKDQVIREMEQAGFQLVDIKPVLRTNYFLEFVKSGNGKSSQ